MCPINSDLLRLTMYTVEQEKCIPFPIELPNRETIEAFKEAENGEITRFINVDEAFNSLGY